MHYRFIHKPSGVTIGYLFPHVEGLGFSAMLRAPLNPSAFRTALEFLGPLETALQDVRGTLYDIGWPSDQIVMECNDRDTIAPQSPARDRLPSGVTWPSEQEEQG